MSSIRSSTSLLARLDPGRIEMALLGLGQWSAPFGRPRSPGAPSSPRSSTVFTRTTRMGATRTTVTGTARCWSSQTCVMPTFSPTIALVATVGRSFRSLRPARSNGRQSPRKRSGKLARQRSARRPERSAYRLCPKVPTGTSDGRSGTSKRQVGPESTRGATLHQVRGVCHGNCPVESWPDAVRPSGS